ncbi:MULTISPECIES: LacI family DNA-binding transcriptional regulator [unclassified Streptomyces]|uniref:LacI family DNA-binding transcriptional regulator n=1 Tax=unclassified Streptomyces TaxID=2593676 RepID=UPI00035E858A|nr:MULTISPECIES: LacI family DNA-binding transcriptional regulator [unclassified Streptomyces]MYY03127.1 substrate-binding domain-containing protein [Streptomyces sp. SID4913]
MTTKLIQVAEFAGVSQLTVRRVLNSSPSVAPATRERVLRALDVLGLQRPAAAANERSPLVGLVVPDLQNPVFPSFVEALAGRLNKRGYVPVLCTRTADGVSEANYVEMLLAQNIGGIVFVGSSYTDVGAEQGAALKERQVPMVLVNVADENPDLVQISADDTQAVQQAMLHLEGMGHERIGLVIGPGGHVPSVRKLRGFAQFWQARGVDRKRWLPWVGHTLFSLEAGARAISDLLGQGVTAVVCGSDTLALGVVRGARREGLRVPEDLSVVGFDDSAFMSAVDPPLTTCRQPVAAMAEAAVGALTEQIQNRRTAPGLTLFQAELIVRSSTARPSDARSRA